MSFSAQKNGDSLQPPQAAPVARGSSFSSAAGAQGVGPSWEWFTNLFRPLTPATGANVHTLPAGAACSQPPGAPNPCGDGLSCERGRCVSIFLGNDPNGRRRW